MRSRILAIIILVLFLVLPGILYWYFFHQNTSGIKFHSSLPGQAYEVLLSGKLEYTYLPLADTILNFREQCLGDCTIIVPPVKYEITLTSSGMEDVHDILSIRLGVNSTYRFTPTTVFNYTPLAPLGVDPILESSLLENANTHFGGAYRHIGTSAISDYMTLRENGNIYTVGILSAEKFRPLFDIPSRPKDISLDQSRQYIIIDRGDSDRFIYTRDGRQSIVFPFPETISIIDAEDAHWKIRTEAGVYTYEGGKWKKNPRFSDYIDITDMLRIGYIDRTDTRLLELSNLTPDSSTLILIDRSTGRSRSMKTGLDIRGFSHQVGIGPVMIFPDTTLGKLTNTEL